MIDNVDGQLKLFILFISRTHVNEGESKEDIIEVTEYQILKQM
jgi:hypothetical protein